MEPSKDQSGYELTEGIPLYSKTDFYAKANGLRAEFEQKLSGSLSQNGGVTPFAYAFYQNKYRFLTANAERVFQPSVLDDLIDNLRSWASSSLGVSHVSTPQMRVFIHQCGRDLLRDQVHAQWRYVLSLTPSDLCVAWLKVSVSNGARNGRFHVDRAMKLPLKFNELIVHAANSPYAMTSSVKSMDPLDGAVFLDGYLW